jgi:molecular chaperone DnaK
MEMDLLVGIDFGTTNTVITIFENNKSRILMDSVFKTIPSKIASYNNMIYCGNYIPINSSNVIHSFKITIGENKTFNINNIEYSHSDLLIIFFQHIYNIIVKNTNNKNIKAVITVPSNFNDMQRELIRSCFNAVSINVIRIINEPSAAALAYGLNTSGQGSEKILVIDTGGGTMDFTILEKTDLFFEVIHSEGLNDLGGNNFTDIILNDMKKTIKCDNDNMWNVAQKIKEKLTYLDSYEVKVNKESYNLTKTKFENLSNILIKKVETTLTNITTNYNDINYIILVGGTSRIPFLQKQIQNVFNKKPWIHPNLETVVAEGAALYCGIIENKFTLNDDVVLMDVLPLSLGVELVDGTYSIIIPKNTPLPVKRTEKYTTDSPCESKIKVKVYQGERKIASKNFLIGEFIFDKVSVGGVPIIEISFKVDLNSIINVIIVDKKSGVEKSLLIKDIPKIELEQVEKIIDIANKLADTDNEELTKIQNIYLIKTHIENALINLEINDMINTTDKDMILTKFKLIEETVESMNSLQLVETITELQNNFSILGSAIINEKEDSFEELDKILFQEKKEELKRRIELLLAKIPEWDEFLGPVLKELSYNTCSSEYVNEKMNVLDDLEKLYNDSIKDYKLEVNNLCLYLKSEIENGSINLGSNTIMLSELVNNTMLLLNDNSITDWEEQLNILNKNCEKIYNLK